MLHVCVHCRTEGFFCTFHEVAAATAMDVQLNTSRYDVASLGIDLLCTFDGQSIVRNGQDLTIFHDDASVVEPTFRRQDASIGYLL